MSRLSQAVILASIRFALMLHGVDIYNNSCVAQASKTGQLRSNSRFPNRLAILNEDRILSGGWDKAFRIHSMKFSDRRAYLAYVKPCPADGH